MKRTLGIILAFLLLLALFVGEFCIMHFIGGYSIGMSIGCVLITVVSAMFLIAWIYLIGILLRK